MNSHLGIRNCFKTCNYLEHLELTSHCLKVNVLYHLIEHFRTWNMYRALSHSYFLPSSWLQQPVKYPQGFPLEIQVLGNDGDIPALQCLELEAFSDITFSHLRKVELDYTIGSNPEIQLIKLLLPKSLSRPKPRPWT
ncbi:hypothetical protein CQW23_25306 [Capsicum baccatum]|uniref:FBD domain-containing protein n=1 Tax=Capsicum baccatum TaxID=33114 RepID=A0A2G2VKJ4_CAPBA|nr:hypothetical protein CQW23_25306 [Capsicum baccatum]